MGETVERVKQLWETWDIRALVLTSLSIQILLTLLAPLRKRCASGFLVNFMWILYLSADAVALFTIGLISSNVDDGDTSDPNAVYYNELLTFWAPFLLLHLGGPDTITALALEDNELWRRHALQFATQLAVTLYVFSQFFRHSTSLLGPTLLVVVDGCIKYTERTFAMYYASVNRFKISHLNSSHPNYAMLMEELSSAASGSNPASSQRQDNENGTLEQSRHSEKAADHWYQVKETDEMVKEAYGNYNSFKGLIADLFLSSRDREESRRVFLRKPAREAFRIIEIELNFIYEVFYTKAYLLQRKRRWTRLVSFISVTASLVWFSVKDKSHYSGVNVRITFVLLVGAVALDISAYIMFLLSDWPVVFPSMSFGRRKIAEWLPSCSKWATYPYRRSWSHSRWSQSIKTYSLLEYSLRVPPRFCFEQDIAIIRWIKDILEDFLVGLFYVRRKPLDEQIGNFISEELWKKADVTSAESVKKACAARGNLVCQDDHLHESEYLRPWTVDVEYDESLLIWHLATDLCYWTTDATEREDQFCKISKNLSDYMSYLFIRQQTLVAPVVGIKDIIYQDTCAEIRTYFERRLDSLSTNVLAENKQFMSKILRPKSQTPPKHETLSSGMDGKKKDKKVQILELSCKNVLQVRTDVQPTIVRGDRSKSVLFDACRLAKQLKIFGDSQWKITAMVWVELLSYAAVRCPPRSHVAELNKGGELITVVWLLMAHLGLGERFRQDRNY